MYGNIISLKLVIHLIKEVDKDISNKEISQWEDEDKLIYILEVEINIVTDSIMIAGTETLLNIIFIALRDERENIYSKLSR